MRPPFSSRLDRTLLLGDAGALLTYNLGLSTARTLELAGPDFDAATDLASANLHLTVQYIEIVRLRLSSAQECVRPLLSLVRISACAGTIVRGRTHAIVVRRRRRCRGSQP